MKNGTSLNFVIGRSFLVVHLLSREDESLLWGWDSLFLFNALLDPLDFVGGLNVDLDLFSGQGLDLNQHLASAQLASIGSSNALFKESASNGRWPR